jgi:hypothetical protein
MRIPLLSLAGAVMLMGCPKDQKAITVVHQTTVNEASSRDTIIKQSSKSLNDTIIKHMAASAPDSCLKIPKPPGCPEYITAMKIDTIPRP